MRIATASGIWCVVETARSACPPTMPGEDAMRVNITHTNLIHEWMTRTVNRRPPNARNDVQNNGDPRD